MKCPDCGAKLTATNYDPEWEMYECPKCKGLHTVEEVEMARVEARLADSPARSNGRGGRDRVSDRLVPVAKGKKRRTEIQDDAELLDAETERLVSETVKAERQVQHKDETGTTEILNVWADEIQAVYEELGGTLDDLNAHDKALTLWREIQLSAREQEIAYVACKEHA